MSWRQGIRILYEWSSILTPSRKYLGTGVRKILVYGIHKYVFVRANRVIHNVQLLFFWRILLVGGIGQHRGEQSTVFFRVIRFFAKTGFCLLRLGTQPLQTITQPHCCRLLKPTPWLLCWLEGFEGPFQTPGTGLAKNRKTRDNTVFRCGNCQPTGG